MRRPRPLALLLAAALVATTAGALQPAPASADTATSTITLFLKAPHPAALSRLASAHNLPRSARLAALARLVPSAAVHGAVVRSLRANGFRILDQTSWSITAQGAGTTSAHLFGTRPTLTTAGRRAQFRAAIGPLPRIPGTLAGAVTAVFPSTGGPAAYHHHSTGPLDGSAFRNAYAPAHTTPSTGQNDGPATVATMQLANFYGLVPGDFNNSKQAKDLSTYASRHGISDPVNGPDKRYTAVRIFGGPSAQEDSSGGDIEVELDQESILSTAPSAHQQAYFAPNTNAGFNQAFAQAYDDVVGNQYAKAKNPHIVAFSTSWGGCESETGSQAIRSLEPILQSLTAAGVTVFAAAGDAGIYDCSQSATPDVDYPGSSPSVISVGGTHLRAAANQPNTGRNWTETGWSCNGPDDCQFGNGGTGGGRSGTAYVPRSRGSFIGFPAPIYQRAAIDDPPFRNNPKRLVPDIASNATVASGFRIYTGDIAQSGCACNNPVVGGTSLSSPVSAALLTNAVADSGHTTGVGDVHGALYSAYRDTYTKANTDPAKAVRDIVSGHNGSSTDRGKDPSVSAGRGYDTVSGVGAVYWPAVLRYVYDNHAPVVRSVQFTEPHPGGPDWRTITARWRVARGADPRLVGASHVVVRRLGGRTVADYYSYPGSGQRSFVGVPGASYRVSVQARDIGRHQSAPSSATVRVPLDDRMFRHGPRWHRTSAPGDIAGSHLNAYVRGVSLSAGGVGTRYAVRVHVGPRAGRLGISYRGTHVATVDLHAARAGTRTVTFYRSPGRAGRTFSFTDLTNKWVSLDALLINY